MPDIPNSGNPQTIISDELDNNLVNQPDPYDNTKYRQETVTKYSTDNAAVSSFGLPKVSFEGIQKAIKWSQAVLQINFIESITGSASSSISAPNILQLNSGAASSSAIDYISKFRINQSTTKGLMIRVFVSFPDVGVTGNVRQFGLYDKSNQNGWLLRLNGTSFQFVVVKSGVETLNVDAASWDVPFSLDTNIHLYEVQTKSAASGDFDIYIDKQLRHSIKNTGTSATKFTNNNNNQIYVQNENTTNATDVAINIEPINILNEGENKVVVSDGTRDILINSSRRLLVQAAGSPLMGEKFDKPLDIVNRWLPTLAGAGTYSQPGNDYTLYLSNTTAAAHPLPF
jgi:hypothetical protein